MRSHAVQINRCADRFAQSSPSNVRHPRAQLVQAAPRRPSLSLHEVGFRSLGELVLGVMPLGGIRRCSFQNSVAHPTDLIGNTVG